MDAHSLETAHDCVCADFCAHAAEADMFEERPCLMASRWQADVDELAGPRSPAGPVVLMFVRNEREGGR